MAFNPDEGEVVDTGFNPDDGVEDSAFHPNLVESASTPVIKQESPSIVTTAKDMLADYFKHLPFVNDEGYVIQPKAKAGINASAQFVKEHPAETALGVASIPLAPETLLGVMLLGGTAAGARAFDKTHPFTNRVSDYKTMTTADNMLDIGGSGALAFGTGALGASVHRIANATKDINEATKNWKALEDAKDLAYESALAKKAREAKAFNAFSDRASKANALNDLASGGDKALGNEAYKYYWANMRARVGNYIEHTDPMYMYGGTRYGMKPSDDVIASYIEQADAPIIRDVAAPEPNGLDLTAALPNSTRVALKALAPGLSNNKLIPKLIAPLADAARNSQVIPTSRVPLEHLIRSKMQK